MGRGKQKTNHFDTLFGKGRGQYSSERFVRLDAPRPTAGQQELVDDLITRSREEKDLSILTEELRTCGSVDAEKASLMLQVIEEVTDVLATQGEKEWHGMARSVATIIGIRSMNKAETLVKRERGNIIHVWPGGRESVTEWADKEKGNKTLCGVSFDTSGTLSWRRVLRGYFADPPDDKLHACKRCARLVALDENRGLYPEATETCGERADQKYFLWPETEQACMESIKERLRGGLMPAICAPRGRLREVPLKLLAYAAAREAYLETFIAEAQRRPKFIIHRSLEDGRYGNALARDFNIRQASSTYMGNTHFSEYISSGKLEEYFATWFSDDDWEKLITGFMPNTAEKSGLGSSRRGNEWKDSLLNHLKRLAKEQGLPREEPVILPSPSAEGLFYEGETTPNKTILGS